MDTHLLDGDDVLASLARSEADANIAGGQALEEAGLLKTGRCLEKKIRLISSYPAEINFHLI